MTSAERHRAAVGLLVLWTPPGWAVGPLAGLRPRERLPRMLPGEPLDGLRTAAVEQRRVRQG
jgi:hypothetical protein